MICPPTPFCEILSEPDAVVRLGIAGGAFVGLIWPAFYPLDEDYPPIPLRYTREKTYFLKSMLIGTSIGTAAGALVKLIGQQFC